MSALVRRGLGLVLVLALVVSACGGADESPRQPTSTSGGAVATTTADIEVTGPQLDVVEGEQCNPPGSLGVTENGRQLLCSETALDGSALEAPTWRDTAARDVAAGELTEAERAAVELLRELDPPVVTASTDTALAVMIGEYLAALELAADRGQDVDEAFSNLIQGLAQQNGLSNEVAFEITLALVMAATVVDADSPGAAYGAAIVERVREVISEGS